jgi:hypothetical protein
VSKGSTFITAGQRPAEKQNTNSLPVKAGLCTLSIRTIDNFSSASQNGIPPFKNKKQMNKKVIYNLSTFLGRYGVAKPVPIIIIILQKFRSFKMIILNLQ